MSRLSRTHWFCLSLIFCLLTVPSCKNEPEKVLPPTPKPLAPTGDPAAGAEKVRVATTQAGAAIDTNSRTIFERAAQIRFDLNELATSLPGYTATPQYKGIPLKLDDIDNANRLIGEQSKVIAAQGAALDTVVSDTRAWRLYAESLSSKVDDAYKYAKAKEEEAKAAKIAQEKAESSAGRWFRAVGYGFAGLCFLAFLGCGAMAVVSVVWMGRPQNATMWGVLAGLCFLSSVAALAFMEYLKWFIIGGGVMLIAAIVFSIIQIVRHRKELVKEVKSLEADTEVRSTAINELAETLEWLKSKLPLADRIRVFGDGVNPGKIDQKALQSPETKALVKEARTSGKITLADPVTTDRVANLALSNGGG